MIPGEEGVPEVHPGIAPMKMWPLIGDMVSMGGLALVNILGPLLLDASQYGLYARMMGVAMIPVALVAGPYSTRMALGAEPTIRAVCHVAARLVVLVGVVSIAAGLRLTPGPFLLAVGFFSLTLAQAVFLRRGERLLFFVIAGLGAIVGSGAFLIASFLDRGAETVVLVHGLGIAGGVSGLALFMHIARSRRTSVPSEAPITDRDVGDVVRAWPLSVPPVAGALTQWSCVLILGRVAGNEAAAVFRVGTVVIGLAATSLPFNGTTVFRVIRGWGLAGVDGFAARYARVAWAAVVWVGVVAVIAALLLPRGLALLGEAVYIDILGPIALLLTGAGAGFALLKAFWPFSLQERWTTRRGQIHATIAFVCCGIIAAAASTVRPTMLLIALSVLYISLGFAVIPSLRLKLHSGSAL